MSEPMTDRELLDATQVAYMNIEKDDINKYVDRHHHNPTLNELVEESRINNRFSDYATMFTDPTFASGLAGQQHQVNFEDVKDWQVLAVCNDSDKSGMYALILGVPNGDAVIAFRGSDGELFDLSDPQFGKDWIRNDLALLDATITPQQSEAIKLVADNVGLLQGRGVHITGHSLGGNITFSAATAMVFAGLNDELVEFVNYDGPGYSDEHLNNMSALVPDVAKKGRHVVWSVVGSLLFSCTERQYVEAAEGMSGMDAPSALERHAVPNVLARLDEDGMLITSEPDNIMSLVELISCSIELGNTNAMNAVAFFYDFGEAFSAFLQTIADAAERFADLIRNAFITLGAAMITTIMAAANATATALNTAGRTIITAADIIRNTLIYIGQITATIAFDTANAIANARNNALDRILARCMGAIRDYTSECYDRSSSIISGFNTLPLHTGVDISRTLALFANICGTEHIEAIGVFRSEVAQVAQLWKEKLDTAFEQAYEAEDRFVAVIDSRIDVIQRANEQIRELTARIAALQ